MEEDGGTEKEELMQLVWLTCIHPKPLANDFKAVDVAEQLPCVCIGSGKATKSFLHHRHQDNLWQWRIIIGTVVAMSQPAQQQCVQQRRLGRPASLPLHRFWQCCSQRSSRGPKLDLGHRLLGLYRPARGFLCCISVDCNKRRQGTT
jgi:hypothetical protein